MLIDKQWLGALFKKQITKDLIYTFSAQVFGMLSVFAVNKLVSLGLTVESFSDYSLIRKNAALFASLFAFGLNEALTRYYAFRHGRHGRPEIFGSLLREAMRLLSASTLFFLLLFALLHVPLSEALFDDANAWCRLGLVYLFATGSCFYNLLLCYYLGLGDFKRAAIVQIGVNSMYLVVAAVFSHNIVMLFTLWSFFLIVPLIIMLLVELRKYPTNLGNRAKLIRRSVHKRLLFYGTTRMGSNLSMYAMDVLPLWIILRRFGQREVSLFTVSITVLLMVTQLFSFMSNIFLQRVSLLRASGNYHAISRLVRWAMVPFILIALVGGGLLYIFSDFIIWLLYTKEFLDATSLITITSIALVPKAIFILLKSPIDAFSSRPYILGIMVLSLILYVVLLLNCANLHAFAWAYVWINVVMMALSVIVWRMLLSHHLKGNS